MNICIIIELETQGEKEPQCAVFFLGVYTWRWTRQFIEICLYFPKKQIYLPVSLSVKKMLPWGIFDAIYSYLFVSIWHFVNHKSKWENKVHQGCVMAEREVYH